MDVVVIPVGLVEVEESDVERNAADGRTKPRYPMDPVELQETYDRVRAYKAAKRAEVAAKRSSNTDDDEDDDAAESASANARVLEIIEFAHELDNPAKDAPGATGTLARRLIGHGWEVEISRSLCRMSAVLFVTDSKEGAKKPHLAGDVRFDEHNLETFVIQAVKRAGGQMLALQASWELKHYVVVDKKSSSKFTGAHTYDPILGREWRTTQKGPREPREWEQQEGIENGPLGLSEWLDIVAPKPPAPPKKTKTTSTETATEGESE